MSRYEQTDADGDGPRSGHHGAGALGARLVPVTLNQADRLVLTYGPAAWRRAPVAFGLRISGAVEPLLLESALTWTARRHTALRTYFPELASTQLAMCLDASDVSWQLPLIDFSGLSGIELATAERDQTNILTEGFAADSPPLYRASLWKYGPRLWLLGIAIDHLLFDGISISLFLKDFCMVYHHLRDGRPSEDLSVEVSDFSRFCLAEQRWLASRAAEQSMKFWRPIWTEYGPWPRSISPTGTLGASESAGRIWELNLEAKAVKRAIERFTGGRLSLFAFAAGCVMSVVKDTTGMNDCGILYSTARRSHPGTADMLGCLMNRMLLRVDLTDATGMNEIIARTRSAILDSMDHDMMPFEFLIRHFCPYLAGRRPDQPHIAITVDSAPQAPELDGLDVTMTWPVAERAFEEDPRIVLSLQEDGNDSIVLKCGYQTGLFSEQFIDKFMSQISDRLAGAWR